MVSSKQWHQAGGVLRPVLFCVYMDGLLAYLIFADFGCYIGHMFTGVIVYAEDIALLASSV